MLSEIDILIIIVFIAIGIMAGVAVYFLYRYKYIKADIYKLNIEAERLSKKNKKFRDLIEELSDSTNFFIRIFDEHPAKMYLADANTYRIVDANKAAVRFYGYSKSELLSKSLFDINDMPKDKIIQRVSDAFNNESYFESRHILSDGSTREVEILTSPIRSSDNKEVLFSIVYDVSVRKENEKQLNKLYKAVYHSSSTVVITDTKGKIEYVNPKFEEITGYTSEEAIGRNPRILNSGKNKVDFAEDLWETIQSGSEWNGEIINKRKDGSLYWEKASISPVKDSNGTIMNFIKVAEDITEKKEAEEELERREELYRFLTENSFDIVYKVSLIPEPHFEYLSPSIEKVLGYPLKKYYENIKYVEDQIHPNDKEWVLETLNDYESPDFKNMAYRSIASDGRVVWFQFRNKLIYDEKGNITGYSGSGRDVTKEKEAEYTLKENEQKLKLALDSAGHYLWEADLITGIIDLSPKIPEMYGFTPEEYPKTIEEMIAMIHPDERKREYRELQRFLNGETEFYRTEYRSRKKNGEYLWVFSSAKLAEKDDKGNPRRLIGITGDISQRKNNEESLRKSENELRELNATKDKFFSIIAHDMKNPFSTFLNSSELLKEYYHELSDEERLKNIINIHESSQHLYKLLENLLQWSRSQTGRLKHNPEVLDLYEAAFNTTFLLKNSALKKDIRLSTTIKPECYVYFDRNMLNTILRNLVSNSIKFTGKNGIINIDAVKKGNYVEASVSDTGIGIEQEVIDKLFRIDKSHTTKGTQNETGTGLGLILCKEFVEKNGGTIWVKSSPGEGSIFYFTLPVAKGV